MRLLETGPLPLAVTVEDFGKAMPWIEADDPLTIESYLRAAQEVVEVASRRPLSVRAVEIEFDLAESLGMWRWWFPVAPVVSVSEVAALSSFQPDAEIPLEDVALQRGFDEPQLRFSHAALMVADPSKNQSVRVRATVGYAENQQPTALKQAIILIVKEWYDAGVSIGDLTEAAVSFNVKALIKQQRYVRPREFGC
jgi:uncharacterized phiE125 gp8 family phage protein